MDGSDSPAPLAVNSTDREAQWYDDGNVVFCAGESKFRVYKSILAAQSRKFKDILSATSAGNAAGAENDSSMVMTVMLPEDDEDDLYYFFMSIFKPSFYTPPPSRYSLPITLSIMRLAHKYEVHFLIRRAVAHLDAHYPSTQERLLQYSVSSQAPGRMRSIYDGPATLLKVLLLANYAKARWLVPRVMYLTVQIFGLNNIIDHPYFVRLASDQHLKHSMIQSSILRAVELSHKNSWLGMLPSAKCTSEYICAYMSRTAQEQNRLDFSGVKVEVEINGRTFCRECQAAGMKPQNDWERTYWNRYPEMCGFKNWEEVERVRSTELVALGRS